MSRPLITFSSDFGLDDWFVGVVHGVIFERCPEARVIDLTHQIPPGDLERAAFVVEAATPDFPVDTVHLVVVDPGVGTGRRALAVRSRGHLFVGPDNGVFEWALGGPDVDAREITESTLFRSPLSQTFHGRDVFAPVAAALADGFPLSKVGPPVRDPVRLPGLAPRRSDGELIGRVVHVDRFGNVLTNVTERDLADGFVSVPPGRLEVEAGGRIIRGLSHSYGEAAIGQLLALVGSSGRLEIAQVGGDASHRLGLGVRDEVRIRVGAAHGASRDAGRARFER